MGKMPTNSLGKSSELKLHCFCLFDAYSMPKDMCSVLGPSELPQAWAELSTGPTAEITAPQCHLF